MIFNYLRASFHPLHPSPRLSHILRRQFASTRKVQEKNRVYNSPRSYDEWSTLLLLSTSSRRPLITLWTSASCRSCATVLPLVKELIEDEGVGESDGGVGFAEVEVDAVLMGGGMGPAVDYGINAMPTLLAFDKNEPQVETKVTNINDLKSKDFLRNWIQKEASRQGHGGAGGSIFGLFKSKL